MELGPYLLRLALLLPLVCGFVVAALWLAKRVQRLAPGTGAAQLARVVEVTPIAPGARLAVVAFGGRHVLLSVSRSGVGLLGDAPAPGFADRLTEQARAADA